MSGPEADRRADGQLFEEAAGWFARMRGPDAEASRSEFEAWLSRGALHRSAYNRAAEIFALGKTLHEHGDPVAGTRREPVRAKRRAIALLATASAASVGIWAGLTHGNGTPPVTTSVDLSAQVTQLVADRQTRTLALADGSIVRLQPGTILDVRFSNSERQSMLQRGLARFQVAHEARPFIVFAGGGSVTAHGTIFDVSLSLDQRVSVRLVEGAIDVQIPRRPDAGPQGVAVRRLHQGETMSFPAVAGTHQTPASSTTQKAASAGPTDFDNIRVADLIALANRHASRPIHLGDANIGEERLSGRFRVDDPELLCARIAALFDLVVDRADPATIVLRRK